MICWSIAMIITSISPHTVLWEITVGDFSHYKRDRWWRIVAVRNKPLLVDHPIIQDIAKKLDATPAQVLVAWGVYRGYSVIPKSVQEERIISNFKQIRLSQEDYKKITDFGRENYTRWALADRLWLGLDLVYVMHQIQYSSNLRGVLGYKRVQWAGGEG